MDALTQLDKDYLAVADVIAQQSPDLHTKVGCVIASRNRPFNTQGGFNRFPVGIPWTVDRAQRPEKYKYTLHAEHLAILHALQLGYPLDTSTLYSTQIPCSTCCLIICETGIKRVVSRPFPATSLQKWTEELSFVTERFAEADVNLVLYNKEQIQ